MDEMINICPPTNWDEVDNECKEFSLNGMNVEGKVVSVYDGDTVRIAFPIKGDMYKWNCRLSGIDTPELRTKCKLEKQFGYKVRDFLRERILDKVIYVKCEDFDKYGRLLTTLKEKESDEQTINQWLIDEGYAFSYDGGTKKSWSEHLEGGGD